MSLAGSTFSSISAFGYGGAIGNVIDGVLNVNHSTFISNYSLGEGSSIF